MTIRTRQYSLALAFAALGGTAWVHVRQGDAQVPAGAAPAAQPNPNLPSPVPRVIQSGTSGGFTPYLFGAGGGSSFVADEKTQADHQHEGETRAQVQAYHDAEDAEERRKIADRIAQLVAEHFDIRQEIRDRQLQQLEAQVKKLRALHERRAGQKDQIVQDRIRQLLRDAEGLGWGAADSPGGRLPSATSFPLVQPPAGRP